VTSLLFDRDRVDEIEWSGTLPRLGRSALLWIDLERPSAEQIADLVDGLELDPETARALVKERPEPQLADHRDYLHVTAVGLSDTEERRLVHVECLVSDKWLVTIHDEPVEIVNRFRERAAGSGSVGRIEGLGFLANMLEWTLSDYFDAFEVLEREIEEIDAKAMSGAVSSADEVIAELVDMRRETGRLRRALVSHREVILALTHPELEAIASSDSAERFTALRERLEEAAQASRDTRDSIVGSFDVLHASTGRRNNEIVKVLTLASVLFLPGALIAGILGMNFKIGIFETASLFWVVIGFIAAICLGTLAVARMREWI
jgi:magnesium transporter